ncbi:pilus assembly protein TadG-related protein [Streptomyces sp. ML-6]|uniref:pilus assembly protein TadG-related protein n=1 Tax=Streptomyces sp. ML-6 TaxID=2982693 RepID=UPI0024C0955F|nr:pilus assembly protein TadG-related protein [Streptomyces sp. ML-6]MDK0521820.1 pilus assembly protein TadG-related protein [Streptomyces sp. ML-6]
MTGTNRRDAGQAFPIYVVMVAGLLFLVFAFFAVGKAAALRNSAQGAADAAALAAARQAREEFQGGFLASLPEDLLDAYLRAHPVGGCSAASGLASANQTELVSCTPMPGGYEDRIKVKVRGLKPVDSPVLPDSKETKAEAEATAVIKFRCSWTSVDYNDDSIRDMFFFTCGKDFLQIAPASPPPWSTVSRILYDVHLVDN